MNNKREMIIRKAGDGKNDHRGKKICALAAAGVIFLSCLLCACSLRKSMSGLSGKNTGGETSSSVQKSEEKKGGGEEELPADSVFVFMKEAGFMRLKTDMDDEEVPVECKLRYEADANLPDVRTSDPKEITELYERLAQIRVGRKANDGDPGTSHHVTFRLRNDTYAACRFEGDRYIWRGTERYEAKGCEPLFSYMKLLEKNALARLEQKNNNGGRDSAGADKNTAEKDKAESADSRETSQAKEDGSGDTTAVSFSFMGPNEEEEPDENDSEKASEKDSEKDSNVVSSAAEGSGEVSAAGISSADKLVQNTENTGKESRKEDKKSAADSKDPDKKAAAADSKVPDKKAAAADSKVPDKKEAVSDSKGQVQKSAAVKEKSTDKAQDQKAQDNTKQDSAAKDPVKQEPSDALSPNPPAAVKDLSEKNKEETKTDAEAQADEDFKEEQKELQGTAEKNSDLPADRDAEEEEELQGEAEKDADLQEDEEDKEDKEEAEEELKELQKETEKDAVLLTREDLEQETPGETSSGTESDKSAEAETASAAAAAEADASDADATGADASDADAFDADCAYAYGEIISAYADLMQLDADSFFDKYDEMIPAEKEAAYGTGSEREESAAESDGEAEDPSARDKVNYALLRDYFLYKDEGDVLWYGICDYNTDGTPELAVALGPDDYRSVRAVYTFDGHEAVELFTGAHRLGERVLLYRLPDGMFMISGSGDADSGMCTICRIAEDRKGLEVLSEYSYDRQANGNMDHISETERLTAEEFDAKYRDKCVEADKDMALKKITDSAADDFLTTYSSAADLTIMDSPAANLKTADSSAADLAITGGAAEVFQETDE